MAIDNLKDFAADELATEQNTLKSAQDDLKQTSAAGEAAAKKATDLGKQIAAEADARSAILRLLAAGPPAVEVEGLADDLVTHETALHKLNAQFADAQKAAAIAKADVTRAASMVARAMDAVTVATGASKAAEERAKAWKRDKPADQPQVADLVAALRDRNPTLAAAAGDVKNGDDYKKAKARVEKEIPAPLIDDARGRAKKLRDDVDAKAAAELADADAVIDYYTKHGGETGAVVAARLVLQRRERDVRAAADFERQLAAIATTLKDIVTATALSDSIQKRIDQLKTGESVPEEAWRRLNLFDDATAKIDALTAWTKQKIGTVLTDYAAAETALVKALQAEAKARRDLAAAETKLAESRDDASATRDLGQSQVLAALRGDR